METILRFREFELDPRALELRRRGVVVRLRPQPVRLLVFLARRSGRVVLREELRTALWPADTFVRFDLGLNSCVKQVRWALRDNAPEPRFIETLPRRGYRFLAPVTELPALGAPASRPRLAVLPFEAIDAPADPLQRRFADGFTEELTTRLACLRPDRLGVLARTSVRSHGDNPRSAAEIGRDLDVDYLVEGSVRGAGGRLRLTAQLIAIPDEIHMWASSYDGDGVDPLPWQDRTALAITREIALALQIPLSSGVGV